MTRGLEQMSRRSRIAMMEETTKMTKLSDPHREALVPPSAAAHLWLEVVHQFQGSLFFQGPQLSHPLFQGGLLKVEGAVVALGG